MKRLPKIVESLINMYKSKALTELACFISTTQPVSLSQIADNTPNRKTVKRNLCFLIGQGIVSYKIDRKGIYIYKINVFSLLMKRITPFFLFNVSKKNGPFVAQEMKRALLYHSTPPENLNLQDHIQSIISLYFHNGTPNYKKICQNIYIPMISDLFSEQNISIPLESLLEDCINEVKERDIDSKMLTESDSKLDFVHIDRLFGKATIDYNSAFCHLQKHKIKEYLNERYGFGANRVYSALFKRDLITKDLSKKILMAENEVQTILFRLLNDRIVQIRKKRSTKDNKKTVIYFWGMDHGILVSSLCHILIDTILKIRIIKERVSTINSKKHLEFVQMVYLKDIVMFHFLDILNREEANDYLDFFID